MPTTTFDLIILATFLAAALLQALFLRFGGFFRSAERKAGTYRAASGQGTSSKLPLTGGPAMIVAALAAGLFLELRYHIWPGIWPVGLAIIGFGVVGLMDDYGKHRGRGLPQVWKTLGCALVSGLVAWALTFGPNGSEPGLWSFVRFAAETVFLFSFSVAADFSDGIDGLAGGLGAIVAFAMLLAAVVGRADGAGVWAVAFVVIFAFLLFNLPSAWTSKGTVARRARVYLGDSGALAMGGGLAAAAVWMNLGWMFLPAAGIWLVEGFSSMWQAEVLAKRLYRRRGRVERYGAERAPHTEFPLPLLAAPIHHHFEVAGWNRLQIVRLFYALALVCGAGAVLAAALSVWLLVGYGIAAAAVVGLWSLAGLYRTFYLAVGDAGRLVLNSGLPFRLGRLRYHKTVQSFDLDATGLTPDERLWLYRPMLRPDAIETLVRLLIAHGETKAALSVAGTLPATMRQMRLADVLPQDGAA